MRSLAILRQLFPLLLVLSVGPEAPAHARDSCLERAYQALARATGVERRARDRLGFGFEAEFDLSKTPRLLEYYRPNDVSESAWLALPLEERVRRVRAVQREVGPSRGSVGFVRNSNAPDFLDPELHFELRGNLELSANRVSDTPEQVFEALDWIWANIGPASVQGHVSRPTVAGSLDHMPNEIKFDYDLTQLGALANGYEAWVRSGGKSIPGKNFTHGSLRPLDEEAFTRLESKLSAAPRGETMVDVETKLVYATTYRPDLYGRWRVGFEIRNCHERLDCIKSKMRQFQGSLGNGQLQSLLAPITGLRMGPLIGKTSFRALPEGARRDLLAIFDRHPDGQAMAERFSYPLLDWVSHPAVKLGADPEALERLGRATERYLATVSELARGSKPAAENTRELQIALGRWAHESALNLALYDGQRRLRRLAEECSEVFDDPALRRLALAVAVKADDPAASSGPVTAVIAVKSVILGWEKQGRKSLVQALKREPSLQDAVAEWVARLWEYRQGPLRDSFGPELLMGLARLDADAGKRIFSQIEALEKIQPGFLFHSGMFKGSSQLKTEEDFRHFLAVAAGQPFPDSASWMRGLLGRVSLKGSNPAERAKLVQLLLASADGVGGYNGDLVRVKLGGEWVTVPLWGDRMTPRSDSALSRREMSSMRHGQESALRGANVSLASDAQLMAMVQPTEKRVFVFYSKGFPGLIVNGQLYQLAGGGIVHQAAPDRISTVARSHHGGYELFELKVSQKENELLVASIQSMIDRKVEHDHLGKDGKLSCAQFVHDNLKAAGIRPFPFPLPEQLGALQQRNYIAAAARRGESWIKGSYASELADDHARHEDRVGTAILLGPPLAMVGAMLGGLQLLDRSNKKAREEHEREYWRLRKVEMEESKKRVEREREMELEESTARLKRRERQRETDRLQRSGDASPVVTKPTGVPGGGSRGLKDRKGLKPRPSNADKPGDEE